MKKNYDKDEKRVNELKSIGELLNESRFNDKNTASKADLALKYSTIFSFWGDIVGKKFISITKPVSIKANKLYVSAKSPVIIQELNLYKAKLLQKVNSYSKPLGFDINDIIFDYKNYVETTETPDTQIEDKPINIDKKELEKIQLDEDFISKVEKSVSEIKLLNDEQKKEFLKKIIESKKAHLLRNLDQQQNFLK